MDDLESTDKTSLPGKLNLWCLGLLPLSMSRVATELEKLEQLLSYDIFPSPKILASVLEEIHLLALLVTINTEADIGQLYSTQDWKLLVDLGQLQYCTMR